MSPTAARNVGAQITLTPGTVISRRTCADSSACRAISSLDRGDLAVQELDVAQTAGDRLVPPRAAARARASHSRALTPNRSETRAGAHEPAHEHRVDLVLGARARPHQLLAARQPAAQHPSLLVRRPDRVELAGRTTAWPACARRAGRSSRAPGGSRCRWATTTTTRATCGSKIRAISHALPVTSKATRSSDPRLCANSSSRSGVVSIRPAERTTPPSAIATSQNSRCTSKPIALPERLSPRPPLARRTSRRRSGQTTTTDTRFEAQPGKSQGRPPNKHGLEAHRPKRPAQLAFSQKAPVPVGRP